MFSSQFYEKSVSVKKLNVKLLLETVTYIAITVKCIILYCRKYHLHNCNRAPTGIITIKIVTHIFAAETVTCVSVAETCNCIIATETVTCITATER